MRIHHREALVKEAGRKIREAVLEATTGLTIAESIQVITHALSSEVLGIVKYEIRQERHGNTETPGGLEPNPTVEAPTPPKDWDDIEP